MRLKDWDKKIEVVTTDMANSYLSWLPTLLPRATIVIDKFHVIQAVHNRINTTKKILYNYRKEIIKSIEYPEERAKENTLLKPANDNKRLFNYSMKNVVRGKKGKLALKLDTVMDAFPEFRLLRMMYYYVEDTYIKTTCKDAEKAYLTFIISNKQ